MLTPPKAANSFLFRSVFLRARWRPVGKLLVLLCAGMLCAPVYAGTTIGQTTVQRYDVFGGYTVLSSPALGLNMQGFHGQAGLNMRRWYALGLDYSVSSGSAVLKPDLLPVALQQQLGAGILQLIQAGVIPPTYQLVLPTNVFSESFAAGPQVAWRHFSRVTLFARPSLGAFRLSATPRPRDPVETAVAHQLVPSGHKVDWTGFYGVGGGDEVRITPRIGLRTQVDVVHNHPFNDILANGFWTVRYSAGLGFHFGRNILAAPPK